MQKKKIVLIAVILLTAVGLVQAQDQPQSQTNNGDKLGATVDLTYLTKYLWRGFNVYGHGAHGAIQPSVDLDFYNTGLGLKTLYSRANGSGYENSQEMDFTLYYKNVLPCATNYNVGWTYYYYPSEPRRGSATGQAADMQEMYATFSWPEICSAGIVPSYTIFKMWPSKSDSTVSDNGGWGHIFGLGYDLKLPQIPEQPLHLSAELVYNDGFAPGTCRTGSSVDHDWSDAVLGISTNVGLANNLTFTPGFYYQISMDDSVNENDQVWASLGMKYKF